MTADTSDMITAGMIDFDITTVITDIVLEKLLFVVGMDSDMLSIDIDAEGNLMASPYVQDAIYSIVESIHSRDQLEAIMVVLIETLMAIYQQADNDFDVDTFLTGLQNVAAGKADITIG